MNSPYLQSAKRTQLAFGIIDSFVLIELPAFNVLLESILFLATTKHWLSLEQCQLDANSVNKLSASQNYREIRRRAIEFRILTIVPSTEETLIRKLLYVSDSSVAASHFIRGASDFADLRSQIINYDRPDGNIADLILLMENIRYVLQSARKDDFEVVSECVRLQRQLRYYWDSVFDKMP